MTGRIAFHKRLGDDGEWVPVTEYYIDGKPVTEAEFLAAFPDHEDLGSATISGGHSGWPLASDALAVHPKQVAAMRELDKKKGVPTDYTPSGRPVFRDRGHRRAYLKAYGKIDRNSYTGY